MTTFDTAYAALRSAYPDGTRRVITDASSFTISSPGVGVADVNQLLTTIVGEDNFLPSWIPTELRLDRLRLGRRESDDGFDFEMTIAADVDWVVFDGFAVTGGSCTIGYGENGLWGSVSGSASLAGLDLDVSITMPDEIVTARLHTADDGGQFLRRQGFVAPSDSARPAPNEPTLLDASLFGSIRDHQFVLHIAATDVVDVHPFELTGVEIEAHLGTEFRTTLWADLLFEFDTLGPVSILAVADITGSSWSLSGRLEAGDEFTLGNLAADIASAFGTTHRPHLPDVVAGATVDHLTVGFDTATHDVAFECELRWPTDDLAITVALRHSDGALTARGTIVVGHLRFDLVFDKSTDDDSTRTALIGVFSAEGGVHVGLADLVDALGADASTMGDLANDFSFGVHDAILAWESVSTGSGAKPDTAMLFAADLELGVDLSGLGSLPLVGSMLSRDESLRLTFRPIVSTAWTADDLRPVQSALPGGVAPLPHTLDHGARIDAHLRVGDAAPIELPLVDVPADTASDAAGRPQARPVSNDVTSVTAKADGTPQDVEWKEVDRSFGPVRVSQVGVHFDRATKEIEVLLSGSISVAGLELTLMGLGARYGLDDHHLDVTLHGLGLDLRREPLEIAGAFANVDGDFVGKVMIRTEAFGIAALGAFKMISGSPSMFVYGVLDYPLGGPPFFFVDGLAVGFGYNRRFIPPRVGDVRASPLVTDAAGSTTAPATVDEQLTRLHHAVPPAVGEYFVAAGVKFTSFKLLESFVLLVVGFGEHIEIDIIGISTYQTPPGDLGPVPPMARAELGLVGRISPDDGAILIQAQLTEDSYVYNPLCHIYGGFAFASWFSGPHEGDFVLSVGGYHPDFTPPAHYPVPPRIGIKYQITPHIYVKGEGYFAVTPALFMAGAALEASVEVDSASAFFRASLDFLIGWEPYHYDAHLRIEVSAKWHCFHTSASVDLHIWGPDFAGHAEVQWTVFSFDVSFGHGASLGPTPIGFDRFRDAFLPAPDKACSIRCAAGLVDSVDNVEVEVNGSTSAVTMWNVNAKELRIETSSVIPEPVVGGDALGIAPMNRRALVGSGQTVTVTRDGQVVDDGHFDVEPLAPKAFPSALWGTTIARSVHDASISATAGHVITVNQPVKPAATHPVPRHQLVASTPIHAYAGDSSWSLGHTPSDNNVHAFADAHPELPWHLIRHVESSGGLG